MNRRSFLTSSFVAAAGAQTPRGAVANGAEVYVAPSGRDENPGNKIRPFATLQRARDEVRKLVAKGLKSNVTVWIRGGTYTLRDPLVFGLEDSGTDRYSLTYQAVPGERPIITSGVKITGWKEPETMLSELPVTAGGKVWVADVPDSLGRFYTLYDERGHLPRAQGRGFNPEDPPAGVERNDRTSRVRNLYYPAGILRNWSNLDDVEIVIRSTPSSQSTMNVLALESVDEKARLARTKIPATYSLAKTTTRQPTAWVENVLEVLDHPGAWALNTHTRKLYLWPRTEKPEGIVAPRLRELIRVEGKIDIDGPTDIPVRNLIFRGLTFAHADRDVWNENDVGMQHDWEMIDKPNALVRLRGAERCTVQNCRFRDSGGDAVRLDLYAQGNRIEGNEIRHMGQGGILLLGYGAGRKDVNKRNEILNNHIHDCGLIYWHSLGVVLWQSGENHVANNYIHHMPRHAICLAGPRVPYFQRPCDTREICKSLRWQEIGGPKTAWDDVIPFLHTRKNLIENNEVERVLQKLGDGAAINVSGCGEGDLIKRNYVHDIFSNEWVSGCLRTDDWQRGTTWEENVIYRSNAGAWEHKGGNSVINNYAIDVLPRGYFRIFRDGPGERIDGSVLERNIFYNSNGAAVFYTFAIGPQQVAKSKIEHNLYYCGGVQESSTPAFLQTLRAQGVASTDAYADPMFLELQPRDFRLRPDSPALKMGIKQIDLKDVGLRRDFPKWLLE